MLPPEPSTDNQAGPRDGAAPPGPSRWWRQPTVWLGFIFSGAALITFVVLFDAGQILTALGRVEPWSFPLAGVVFLASHLVVRALRWRLLLRPLGRFPYGQVRDVMLTGFMINNILPARAGELARALVLWRVAGASRRGALASIGIERLFDGVVLIGLLSLLGLLFEVPPWTRRLGHITSIVLAGLVVTACWLAFHQRSLFWLMERALFFLPRRLRGRVVAFFERFAAGTRSLRSISIVAPVAGLTLLIWSMELVVYYTMMRGFGIELPAWAAALALVVTNFGIAVPSAPGHVGVYEAACSGALIGLGLNKELALSYALGVHLLLFVCITTTGMILMWRLGLKLRDVTGRAPPNGGGPVQG